MKEWIPLLQSLVWPAFLMIVLVWARNPLLGILALITRRIKEGAGLRAGPFEMSESSAKLPVTLEPSEAPTDEANQQQREDDLGFYIAHKARRDGSLDRGEFEYYRLRIYLEWDPGVDDSLVAKVVYHLPEGFPLRDPEITDPNKQFEFRTAAWGQFNITAEVYLRGRGEPIELQRYLNF